LSTGDIIPIIVRPCLIIVRNSMLVKFALTLHSPDLVIFNSRILHTIRNWGKGDLLIVCVNTIHKVAFG
jgi:hypothetical protein